MQRVRNVVREGTTMIPELMSVETALLELTLALSKSNRICVIILEKKVFILFELFKSVDSFRAVQKKYVRSSAFQGL